MKKLLAITLTLTLCVITLAFPGTRVTDQTQTLTQKLSIPSINEDYSTSGDLDITSDLTITGPGATSVLSPEIGLASTTPTQNLVCDFSDDFSSALPWTQYGTRVNVSGGVGNFINSPDASDQRIVRQLNPRGALDDTTWTAEIEFTPKLSTRPVGHTILSFTSGPLNPYRQTPTGAYTNQDFIEITNLSSLSSVLVPGNLHVGAKDGASPAQISPSSVQLPTGGTFYLRLQRNGNTATLSVFSDAARTIPVGTPVSFSFTGTVTGLTHVQIGSIIQGASIRILNATVDNLCITGLNQCRLLEDYLSIGNWTQVGTNVSVTGGAVAFNNATDGNNTQRRVYRSLNGLVLNSNTWSADFDFLPTAVGTGGPGHTLLAMTAGTLDTFNTNTYAMTNQDAIAAVWNSTNHTNQPATFMLDGRAKNDNGAWSVSPGILLAVGTQYYLTLERLDQSNGRISAFLDAGRTQHAPGSPRCFTIPTGVTNLDFLQHGTIPQGGSDRALTGSIDNTCIGVSAVNPGSLTYKGPASFCSQATAGLIDSSTGATGGWWNWIYEWEQSDCTGAWTSIPGATSLTYLPSSPITRNTCYRRKAVGPCGVVAYTNVVSFTAYQPLQPTISVSGTPSPCSNNNIKLTANVKDPQGVSYVWNTGATSQSIDVSPATQTTYSVTASNSCYSGSASHTLTPCYSPSTGSFPKVYAGDRFSVNWSGNCTGQCELRVYDSAIAQGAGPAYGATKGTLRVFNRWGQMIHQQVETSGCGGLWNGIFTWNGVYGKKPVKKDVYPWRLILEDCNHNTRVINGAVSVLGAR